MQTAAKILETFLMSIACLDLFEIFNNLDLIPIQGIKAKELHLTTLGSCWKVSILRQTGQMVDQLSLSDVIRPPITYTNSE